MRLLFMLDSASFSRKPKDIEAKLDTGVLTITIKKLLEEHEKTHQIEIKKT